MFRRNPKMKELSVPSRVSNPPPRPLMIWDGECHFCRRWIERWREITAGEVEYAPYQEIADRFPEIPREQFQRSVVYIDKTGQVFVAAEAVYRSLRCRPSKKWLWWSYQHIPGFAAVSEFRLQLHRTASRVRLGNNAIALGKRRSAPNLFLGASLVSTCTRSCLFDRVRFTLDPDRRSRWSKWHFANQRLFVAGTPRDWIQSSLDSADTLLV